MEVQVQNITLSMIMYHNVQHSLHRSGAVEITVPAGETEYDCDTVQLWAAPGAESTSAVST